VIDGAQTARCQDLGDLHDLGSSTRAASEVRQFSEVVPDRRLPRGADR